MYKIRKYISYTIQKNPRWQPFFWSTVSFFRNFVWWEKWKLAPRDNEKCLFIVGCGRSGNTLLRRLLMEKYDIYLPPETYVLGSQIVDYKAGKNKSWAHRVETALARLEYQHEFETFGIASLSPFALDAKEWPVDKRSFQDLIINLYKWMASLHGRHVEWVGDKTPLNTLNLGLINRAFPRAKFVFMERDPVDVVASYLNAGIYSSPSEAAERWVKSYLAWEGFSKLKPSTDIIEIKYEDLVSDSSQCITDIGNKFHIPLGDEKKIRANAKDSFLGDVGMRLHHSNVLKAPSSSSIGKGRSNMDPVGLSCVRNVIGNLAVMRGYKKI